MTDNNTDKALMEDVLNYKFKDESILLTALTHSSYANEARSEGVKCNERLEFLGDAVLGFVIGSYLYKTFPDLPEGKLTKLRASVVCDQMLSRKAKALGIDKYLRLGKGEELTGGRERVSILEDAFESVIGAIYMDGGIEEAARFVLSQLKEEVATLNASHKVLDNKTSLQEILQRTSQAPIEYVVIGESGPAHNKLFKMEVRHNGRVLGSGIGKSKKEAEQHAAQVALEKLQNG
jgi:ribonuclease-3